MFIIYPHTKVASVIKANKDSIDAIAALSKPLEKLKNPLLRKLLAGRVTLAEAAKMGGCSLHDFEKALLPLGFRLDYNTSGATAAAESRPPWLKKAGDRTIVRLDVRPVLAASGDPLKAILQHFRELPDGHLLCIINSFIPYPLIKLLEREQALSFTETLHAGLHHTYFLKQAGKAKQSKASGNMYVDDLGAFAKACSEFSKEQIVEIDVRALEMPGPMEAILQQLQVLKDQQALYVYHNKVPVYLLEELADKAYHIHILTQSATDTRLLIYKV